MSKAIYVFDSLGVGALASESCVQLLLFAAKHKQDQDLIEGAPRQEVILLAVDGDISGEDLVREHFKRLAEHDVGFQPLLASKVPAIGYEEQQEVLAVFEALKRENVDEIHFLDAQGYGYYLTLAKQCGVHLCDTTLVVHVVGGTLFSLEAEEKLVDSENMLLLDVFECGSTSLADVAFVHDRKAWAWYGTKLPTLPSQVIDISWKDKPRSAALPKASPAAGKSEQPTRVIFWGPLSQDAGLRGFCDAITAYLRNPSFPIEVVFVGQARSAGVLDSVSYIRIRSQNWKVSVRIERSLTLLEELELVARGDAIVFCDASRREGLRARIYDGLDLPFVLIGGQQGALERSVPSNVVRQMVNIREHLRFGEKAPKAVEAWSTGRAWNIQPVVVPALASLQNEPKVSVIVTHFSRPDKLRFALQSMIRQTYRNFEVIVVDDGSYDSKILSELDAIGREIEAYGWKLIRQENRYLGAARNCGARAASGKYLLFMDDDNCARPDELATLVSVAERLNAQVVTPFYYGFENDGEIAADTPLVCFAPVGGDIAFAVFSPALGDANALYTREMFHRIGGFSEDYGITHEDWELHIRADLAGARRVTVPVPLFWYRIDPAGMYRNELMQLHRHANLRRHIRPFLETLPHQQAKLVQIAQGLLVNRHHSAPRGVQARRQHLNKPSARALPFGRVAIIVRTKDRPLMLQRAIKDILAQTYGDWILVVVNDGGDAAALELVLEQFADQLANRLVTINNPVSVGMQTASNIGIAACDSDFIVIHDDDDTWKPEFLARTVGRMDQEGWNPRVVGVVSWSEVIVEQILDGYQIVENDRFIFNDRLFSLSLVELGIENRFPPISFLFRRTAFEEVGRFREEFGVLGDWDFHLRVLERFDVEVIPEPLAGYHHRHEETSGAYGNSVHAQRDVHVAKRMELVNSFVRNSNGSSNGAIAQLLLHGQLYKSLESEQVRRFQKLHDHIWEVEQRMKQEMAGKSGKRRNSLARWLPLQAAAGNLVENGDFRDWPGPGEVFAVKALSSGIVCPGLLVTFEGREKAYTLERLISDGRNGLPKGKTYLRVVNRGQDSVDKWFWLEFPISDIDAVAGQKICVSGKARLKGVYEWISLGGRIDLPDRGKVAMREQKVFLSEDFQPWSCALSCPSIERTDQSLARIQLKLHYSEPFILELTDMQVEQGDKATGFRYAKSIAQSLRQAARPTQ